MKDNQNKLLEKTKNKIKELENLEEQLKQIENLNLGLSKDDSRINEIKKLKPQIDKIWDKDTASYKLLDFAVLDFIKNGQTDILLTPLMDLKKIEIETLKNDIDYSIKRLDIMSEKNIQTINSWKERTNSSNINIDKITENMEIFVQEKVFVAKENLLQNEQSIENNNDDIKLITELDEKSIENDPIGIIKDSISMAKMAINLKNEFDNKVQTLSNIKDEILENNINLYNKLEKEVDIIKNELSQMKYFQERQEFADKNLKDYLEGKKNLNGRKLNEKETYMMIHFNDRYNLKVPKGETREYIAYLQYVKEEIRKNDLFASGSTIDNMVLDYIKQAEKKGQVLAAIFETIASEKQVEVNGVLSEIKDKIKDIPQEKMTKSIESFNEKKGYSVEKRNILPEKVLRKTLSEKVGLTKELIEASVEIRKIAEITNEMIDNNKKLENKNNSLEKILSSINEKSERNNNFAKPLDSKAHTKEALKKDIIKSSEIPKDDISLVKYILLKE